MSGHGGETELYFYIDPNSRIIYYDTVKSAYYGYEDKFPCVSYYQENEFGYRICLVPIGKWIDDIPMPDEYPIGTPVGNILFNFYKEFRDKMGKPVTEGPEIIDVPIEQENISNLPFDVTKLLFIGVANSDLSTELYFFIDSITGIIYCDVNSSKYDGAKLNLDCTDYKIQDANVCLVNLGKWSWKDPLPSTGTWYDTSSRDGYRLVNLILTYNDFNKKKTNFSDVTDDIRDLTDQEIMMGEGVVEELRGIRDAILQTGRCYQYTGSPIISMAEQSGSAPFQAPQSSMMTPLPAQGLPPPPPPSTQRQKREKSGIELIREQYPPNTDLTKLDGDTIRNIQDIDSQYLNKLRIATFKAYKDNEDAIKKFNETANVGWTISSKPDIRTIVASEESIARGEKQAVKADPNSIIEAARRMAAKRAAASAEGSGMYRRRRM